ncbi:MAG TPA: metallophosphoesterase [Byssovorax sp.]
MRIAHLSDLHLLALEGAVPMRLFNKRATGYLNLKLKRSAKHKPFAARAAARAIHELGVDHVVVTGDVSNLSLEREFELVRGLLDEELGLGPESISVVPGNHDAYTRGAHRSARFATMFAPYVTSDLPDLAVPGSAFPFVRLRGPAAIVGLSSAVPRPPFVASGELGAAQLQALERVIEHPAVRQRTLVVLQHHPLHATHGVHRWLEGLVDAAAEEELLRRVPRGLVLHGHLHRRVRRALPTALGSIDVVGATSASLLDARAERMGGFNVYELSDAGVITAIDSHRLDPATERFSAAEIPSLA